MKQILIKLWRITTVTVFIFLLFGCGTRDLSHDPKAVDQITTEYIFTDMATDLMLFDSTIASVEHIRMTRQDNIPVALVNLTRKGEEEVREFYYFDFAEISRVREVMEDKTISVTEMSNILNISELHINLYQQIILRAKGQK
jgi:hypothetical protein